MKIEISQDDLGTLCICALRYCHGRRTYMPSAVQQIVAEHFADLAERDLNVISEDETAQQTSNLWGDECDKMDWQNFYQALGVHRQGRSKQ